MKTSKLLITSLLAAAAMGTNAFGALLETIEADPGSSVTKTITSGDEIDLNFGSNGVSVTCAFELSGEDGAFTIGAPKGWKTYILEGAITGSGTLTLKGGTVAGYAFGWALANDMSGFSGKIKLENSNGGINQLKLRGSNGTSFSNIEVDLTKKNGNTQKNILLVETAATIKGVSGTSTDAYVLSNGAQTLTLNTAGSDFSFAGSVGTGSQFYADNSGNAGTNAGTLSLVKSGTGTQTLSGTTYLGNLDVTGGELIFSGASATSKGTASVAGTLTTSGSGVVKVLENGVLDLSGATVSLANAIQNSGQVTLSTGTLFEVSTFGQTVSLISGAGTISGVEWNALTNKNFTYNGVVLGRSTVVVSSAGSVNISYVEAKTLTWNGSASDTWSEAVVGTEPSSKPWKDESNADDAFYAGDSVVFRKDETTTVTVADSGVLANTVTISAGTVSFTGGTITATGGVFVTGGTLSVGATNISLGTNTITLSGGALAASATGTLSNAVNVSAMSEVSIADSEQTLTLSGVVTGSGTLTKTGAGTLALTNAGTSVTLAFAAGNLKVAGATVNIVSTNSAGNIAFAGSGGTVVFKGTDDSAGVSYAVGTISAGESPDNYARNVTVESGATVSAAAFTNDWGMGTVRVDGILNVSGTFSFATGANDNQTTNVITGDGTIKVGTLNIGNVGTYTIDVNRLEIGSGGITISNNRGTGKTTYLGKTTIVASESWSSVVSSNQKFKLNSSEGTTFEMQKSDGTATNAAFASIFEGTGKLIKTGAGTLTLSGNNTFTGGTVIEAGTVVAAHANALGTTKGVEVQSGATLNLGTSAVTVAGLSGAGTVGLAAGTTSSTLTVDSATDSTFSGRISGDMSVVKTGAGTQEFSGVFTLLGESDNAKSVSVQEGMLKLHLDTGSTPLVGSISVSSGSSLGVVAASNSYFGVAASTDGGYTYDGSISFDVGGKLVVDLNSVVVVDGATEIALKILTSSAISFAGTDVASMTLTDATLGGFVEFIDTDGVFSEFEKSWVYAPDEWNSSTLFLTMTIPEPSAFGLLAGAGALALVAARRRRTKRA